ncbi:hypothetical protein, partial [uncultured Sphingomonas sp.]|uniref:hypothetical protein n=1 Tax=uncultured Sphingomonas sp. TaxID=158754 RepID=UPI00374A65B0
MQRTLRFISLSIRSTLIRQSEHFGRAAGQDFDNARKREHDRHDTCGVPSWINQPVQRVGKKSGPDVVRVKRCMMIPIPF